MFNPLLTVNPTQTFIYGLWKESSIPLLRHYNVVLTPLTKNEGQDRNEELVDEGGHRVQVCSISYVCFNERGMNVERCLHSFLFLLLQRHLYNLNPCNASICTKKKKQWIKGNVEGKREKALN